MSRLALLCLGFLLVATPVSAADPIELYAAGSLKAAFGEVAGNDSAAYDTPVETTFGPSSHLRERSFTARLSVQTAITCFRNSAKAGI